MNSQARIPIVICTYNNVDSLAITLQQLTKQATTHIDNVEIILVDNNSADISSLSPTFTQNFTEKISA